MFNDEPYDARNDDLKEEEEFGRLRFTRLASCCAAGDSILVRRDDDDDDDNEGAFFFRTFPRILRSR